MSMFPGSPFSCKAISKDFATYSLTGTFLKNFVFLAKIIVSVSKFSWIVSEN